MRFPDDEDDDLDQQEQAPRPQTALRVVIGITLVIGTILVGLLVLRQTVDPAWLRPADGPAATATMTAALPPAPLPTIVPTTTTASEPSAAPSAPAPAALAGTEAGPSPSSAPAPSVLASSSPRKPPAPSTGAQRGDPEVVELPEDFRYQPDGSGNLTFPR